MIKRIRNMPIALVLFGAILVCSALQTVAGDVEDGRAAYKSGDYSTAFAKFKKAADEGDAKGKFALAILYLQGQGVTQDAKQAVFWLEKSGEGGFVRAYYQLGTMFGSGKGVLKDPQQAKFWYEKAAAQAGYNESDIPLFVAMEYEQGKEIPHDEKRAVFWLIKSAEQGYSPAQRHLARKYEVGEGVAQDYVEAYKWNNLAASGGDPAAKLILPSLERRMTRQQVAEAQRRASEFTVTKIVAPVHTPQQAAVSEASPPIDQQSILSGALISSFFGVLAGGILFLLIKPKGKPTTPSQLGRLWMAWWGVGVCGTYVGKAYVNGLNITQLFIYGPTVLFLLGCGYLAGWLYGRLFKFRPQLLAAKETADESIYEAVMKEFDSSERREGVYAKALAESDGDVSKVKSRYIQYRAQQVKAEAKR